MEIELEYFNFLIIPITLFFALILFPIIHNISNLVTKLGIYHESERFWKERLPKLYHTYFFLSIPLIITLFILLSQNIGMTDPYKIGFISFGASFMIPLIGRICSVSDRNLCDQDPLREKERILSLVFSIIMGTLIIAVLIVIYKLTFYQELFNFNLSGSIGSAIVIIIVFFLLPFFTTVFGEVILSFKGICKKLIQ